MRPESTAQPFYDKAEFEKAKQRAGGIENWIEKQMKGTSVTVVLFGTETFNRPWVKHEIRRSFELKKGMLAIDIHRIKDPQKGADRQGENPLDLWAVERGGRNRSFSELYKTYDWVLNDGYKNLPDWIEAAARAANK